MTDSGPRTTLRQRILLLSFGTTLAVTASLSILGFVELRESLRDAALDRLSADARLHAEKIATEFHDLAHDAGFLAGLPQSSDALARLSTHPRGPVPAAPAMETRGILQRNFASFIMAHSYLTEVRLIERGPTAPELVRVDRHGDRVEIAQPDAHRSKANAPYMVDAATLSPGEWYWSRVTPGEGNGQTASDGIPTIRIVYPIGAGQDHDGGFIVLSADYRLLMRSAIASVPDGTRLTVESSRGDAITFDAETPGGRLRIGDAPGPSVSTRETLAGARRHPSGPPTVRVSREIDIGGSTMLSLTLEVPEATLLAEANRRALDFVQLSGLLLMLASLISAALGHRLAGRLADLAGQVVAARPGIGSIRLKAEGYHEVHVLAEVFQNVFNRLAEQSQELSWRSLHDPLSGLLNRHGIEEAIRERFPHDELVTVIQFDLDRFKLVNDTLGHEAGDAVIAAIGVRLRSLCEPGDVMGRMGGDEFIIVRSGADSGATHEFASSALPVLARPVEVNGRACRFGVSMGAAEGSLGLLKSGELIRRSDHALYRAKGEGRGRFLLFNRDMERRLRDRALIATDLETALERRELVVEYMPKVSAGGRRLIGLEALVRWQHPIRGTLMPIEFLPIADELKLTPAIDRHVLERVMADRRRWLASVPEVPPVSVNVSMRRLLEPALVDSVRAMRIPEGAISFELLESIFLDDAPEVVTWSCEALRGMGIGVEIDDFGSGHASILGISRIRPDWIKIDRGLVQQVRDAGSDTAMLRAIMEMATALGISTVAEGVETELQARIVEDLGCSALQGYFIGRPMMPGAVPDLIRAMRGADQRQVRA